MSAPEKRPPVVVAMSVEFPGGYEADTQEIDRDEWDAMTPEQRTACMERAVSDFAADYVSYGWSISDTDDYLAATGGAS